MTHRRDAERCDVEGGIMIVCEVVQWDGKKEPEPHPEPVPDFVKSGLLFIPGHTQKK
jgi:hypothetical protein